MRSEPVIVFSSSDFDAALMSDLLAANATRVLRIGSRAAALAALGSEPGCAGIIIDAALPEVDWVPVREACRQAGTPVLVLDPPGGVARGVPRSLCVERPIDTGTFGRRVLNAIRGQTTGRDHATSSTD